MWRENQGYVYIVSQSRITAEIFFFSLSTHACPLLASQLGTVVDTRTSLSAMRGQLEENVWGLFHTREEGSPFRSRRTWYRCGCYAKDRTMQPRIVQAVLLVPVAREWL